MFTFQFLQILKSRTLARVQHHWRRSHKIEVKRQSWEWRLEYLLSWWRWEQPNLKDNQCLLFYKKPQWQWASDLQPHPSIELLWLWTCTNHQFTRADQWERTLIKLPLFILSTNKSTLDLHLNVFLLVVVPTKYRFQHEWCLSFSYDVCLLN